MALVPVPKQRPNRLQRIRCFQPEEEEKQNATIVRREAKREEEGRAEADAFFDDTVKLKFTGGNVGFQLYVKGNHLLVQASVATTFNDIMNNPKRRLPVLRWEFDGSSKNLLGRHEGLRTVHRGSKILLFDVSASFVNAMADDEISSVPVFTHACKYPGTRHAVPLDQHGREQYGPLPEYPRELAEGFEVADHVVRTMWPLIPMWENVHCCIIQLLSDSGGSTLNSQLYILRIIYRETGVSKVILWCGRCRVHQGAISGRESCELFMRLAGLNPIKTQKRIYLASLTTKVKTQLIQDGITKILNERLKATDEDVTLQPDQQKLLRSLRVPADTLADLSAVDDVISNSGMRVRSSHYQNVRKAIMKQYKSIKLPVWSRWLTYGDSCRRLLIMMFFYLVQVCSFFGTSIKIRGDEEEENVFHESSMQQGPNQTVWKVTYFTHHILSAIDKLVGHQLRSRETGERISGRELVQAFKGWVDTSLNRLRDTGSSISDLELILHRKLTPEDKVEVTKLSTLASLSVIGNLCNVEFRYGSYRDRHEAWVDSYLAGHENSTSLLAMDISEEDGGDISLKSLQRYIDSIEPRRREAVLADIVERLGGLDVNTKMVEEKIGRFKRASKHDRSHRGVVATDTVSNRAEWQAASKKPQLDRVKSETPVQPVASGVSRYCVPRGVDVARGSKMREANVVAGSGQHIGATVNSWESQKAKSEGKIQVMVNEMHKERKILSANRQPPPSGTCDLAEDHWEEEADRAKTRHHVAVQREQDYYEKVEATARTWWLNEDQHKAACGRAVEVSCNRIHQQLTFSPFSVTVRGRPVSPAEIAVCSAVQFERKKQKVEENREGKVNANVDDDAVPMIQEEEADNPDEEEDILEGIFCRRLCILGFKGQSSSSRSSNDADGNAGDDLHRFLETRWLVLRTDLCANDFTAIELTPRQVNGESVYGLAAGNRRLHSPNHEMLLKAGGQYELHQGSVLFPTPGEDGMLPDEILVKQGGLVVFKRPPKKQKTHGSKTIRPENVGHETAYERDVRRGFLEEPAKRMKVDETVTRLVHQETKNSMAIVKSRVAAEKLVEGPTPAPTPAPGPNPGPTPAPTPVSTPPLKAPKVPKYDLNDDMKLDIQAYRRQATTDLFRYASSGFKCVEGSSASTYKELGVLGNRIRMDVDDPGYALVFLKLVGGEWGIDLKTKAKTNASRYFAYSYGLGYESAARVAGLWAMRTRFIIRRCADYMKDGMYENNDEKGLEAEWQEALGQLPGHVSGDWQKKLQGNDLAAYRDLVILCPMAKSRLKILGVGRDKEVGSDDFRELEDK